MTPTHEFADGNDYPGGAERACLPETIGGYQHLEPDVICRKGDIYVVDGKPSGFVARRLGDPVGIVEEDLEMRIYRKYPVAKQGDNDDTGWKQVAFAAVLAEAERQGAALPTDPKARKAIPLATGLLDYFPDALRAVAELSRIGNEQHNPGKPLHWDRSKSGDEADALMRHLLERDGVDKDGVLHAVKVAWRGLALAQKKLEAMKK